MNELQDRELTTLEIKIVKKAVEDYTTTVLKLNVCICKNIMQTPIFVGNDPCVVPNVS